MTSEISIHRFSSLPILTRASCLQIPDLLARDLDISLQSREDVNRVTVAALVGDNPRGWIRFFPRRFLLYRVPQTDVERLLPAALIEFPVCERFTPEIWEALIGYALAELFELGANRAGIYLPPECARHSTFLQRLGFDRIAVCDSLPFIRTQGYDRACSLWVRRCSAARGYFRPNMYSYLAETGVLYAADVTTAPEPSADFWSQALVYSGYSGYPFLSDFFDTFIERDVRSVLSVPCATADLFRLLPARKLRMLDYGTGVDLVNRNITFGNTRLAQPHLDAVNMLMCHAFLAHNRGVLGIDITDFLDQLGTACGRPLSLEEAAEYGQQLEAAFAEVVLGGAITDWFALMKGFGRLIALSPEPNIFVSPEPDEDGFQYCLHLASKISEADVRELLRSLGEDELLDHEFESGKAASSGLKDGKIRLVVDDMFEMDLGQRYDLIFVWEAVLMAVGTGKEEAFVDQLCAHLREKGRIVLTGLRTSKRQWPRELEIMERLLTNRQFRVALGSIEPRPARWAWSHVKSVRFPVLVGQAP